MLLPERPVFVVGVYRSGTSLLCCLLNQNPAISLMYECDVWNFPRRLLRLRFQRNWAKRIEFYNQALSRHQMIPVNDLRGLEKIHSPVDLYNAFGVKKGASVSGEKSPFYCHRLEQLHRLYPEAYFVFVWRNPVEIYRSVRKAAQTSRFFGKPGMLSRMIYQQEEAIRQAERIESRGARIYRVDYASLVDQTEKVCREISSFLGVPFDPQMLQLNRADLSAIYKSAHHAYLRRGVIERQTYTEQLVAPLVMEKLERYRRRWEQQQAKWLKAAASATRPLPGPVEFIFHNLVGRALTFFDSVVRAGFEFFPLSWLRAYRLLKTWVVKRPVKNPDEITRALDDGQHHWPTILVAAIWLGLTVLVHRHANPHLMFVLFYAMPCALVALVVNIRWASLFALAASVCSAVIQYKGDGDYHPAGIMIWNLFSRFALLGVLILLIGRIRLEFSDGDDKAR